MIFSSHHPGDGTMRPGTIIRLPDGREGTVCYYSWDGIGIRWGRIRFSEHELRAIYDGHGGLVAVECPRALRARIAPEAMLREPEVEDLIGLPCVGAAYEIVAEPS